MVPPGEELGKLFTPTLDAAKSKYNYSDAFPILSDGDNNLQGEPRMQSTDTSSGPLALNSTGAKIKRGAANGDPSIKATIPAELTPQEATIKWDRLQDRGCCGLMDAATTWPQDKLPKSCCARDQVVNEKGEFLCKKIDDAHQLGCLKLIATTSWTLQIVLLMIAAVNLYLAVVSGIGTYKTIHYDQPQGAYT